MKKIKHLLLVVKFLAFACKLLETMQAKVNGNKANS